MLYPCVQCERAIRADETACPFCGAAAVPPEATTAEQKRGLSRREMAALAVGAVTLVGCKKKAPPSPPYGAVWVEPARDELSEV